MSNNLLDLYNKNSYQFICKRLSEVQTSFRALLFDIKRTGDYSKLREIEELYQKTFMSWDISNWFDFNIHRVYDYHNYSLDVKMTSANSSLFLKLNISDRNLLVIDGYNNNILNGLLRNLRGFFKVVNTPAAKLDSFFLSKQIELCDRANKQLEQFESSLNLKEELRKRKQLNSEEIDNLPHPGFYHITHIENLPNILSNGLLSRNSNPSNFIDVANPKLLNKRNRLIESTNRPVNDYAPLYINPLNPFLYSEKVSMEIEDIIMLEIYPHILVQAKGALISDGNAAFMETNFYGNTSALENFVWETLKSGEWSKNSSSARIMGSEILIPDIIKSHYIKKVIIQSNRLIHRSMACGLSNRGIKLEIDKEFLKKEE